jgi:hypothetical protein
LKNQFSRLQLAKFRAGTTNESTSCETDDAKTPFEKSIFNGLLAAQSGAPVQVCNNQDLTAARPLGGMKQ